MRKRIFNSHRKLKGGNGIPPTNSGYPTQNFMIGNLKKIRIYTAKVWFALTRGFAFLTLINFVLLVLANSKRLSGYLNISEMRVMWLSVPVAIFSVWFIGQVTITLGWEKELKRAIQKQSPLTVEILEKIKNIEKILNGGSR